MHESFLYSANYTNFFKFMIWLVKCDHQVRDTQGLRGIRVSAYVMSLGRMMSLMMKNSIG